MYNSLKKIKRPLFAPPTKMLCKTCETIFDSTDDFGWTNQPEFRGKHHETITHLLFAATEDGCGLCAALVGGLASEIAVHAGMDEEVAAEWNGQRLWTYEWDRYTRGSFTPSKYQILRFQSHNPKLEDREFALIPAPFGEDDQASIGQAFKRDGTSHFIDSIQSLNSIRLFSSWLQTFLEEHADCTKAQSH